MDRLWKWLLVLSPTLFLFFFFFFYILKSVKLNTFGFVYCFYNYSRLCHNTASEDFLLQSHEYQISQSSLMDSKEGYEATAASIYPQPCPRRISSSHPSPLLVTAQTHLKCRLPILYHSSFYQFNRATLKCSSTESQLTTFKETQTYSDLSSVHVSWRVEVKRK